ncbi:MAG: hypothetical protein QOG82_1926 [Actinomycetota bacterium]|nr:hypothetical protein [Actinomycetota bacterium]
MLALALLACTACGGGGGDDGGLSDSAAGRRRMPSCGTYTAPTGELPAEDRSARDCFLAAFGNGTQKELTLTVHSLEGDPIITIYRVLGVNDVELFVDASADKFAAVKQFHQRCTSVVEEGNALGVDGCVNLA